MLAKDVGEKLVEFCNAGTPEQAVTELYADNIVSIEPQMDAQDVGGIVEGMPALLEKHAQWDANMEVHESIAEGPYLGRNPDEFVVKFAMQGTPRGGERQHMQEVGRYTVVQGKIVREEFMYLN